MNPISQGLRSVVTPSDPMAAAYTGMVNSLVFMGHAVADAVSSAAPFGADRQASQRPTISSSAQDRDSYNGAWDGTGTIRTDSNPRERQLYLQAQLKAPIFPMDLYYLLYLLDRFDLEGINIDGWDGSAPRAVGDSKPRVLNGSNGTGLANTSTYSSFPPPARPESIRSFSSTALSTLTLITGWKQWSNAASSPSNSMPIADDVQFIHKFLKKITGLRLVSKIPPGLDITIKGKIEGYSGDGILSLLRVQQQGGDSSSSLYQQQQLTLPLAATFSSLTHLELHKIPPRSIDGWESLMPQLKSLVIIQSGIEDVYDVIVTAVVESERRRRKRAWREKSRAVLIRQEQREALKDAMTSKGRRLGQGSSSSISSGSPDSSQVSSPSSFSQSSTMAGDSGTEDDQAILKSIKMWPVLRHLSVSDNALPALENSDTFLHTQGIITLDLSHNLLISPPPGLIHLHNLHNLNLSYNMISTVHSIYHILGNITVLDLKGNRLESLCGLERLWNLEKINVCENQLDEASEVGRLAALPGIREVWSESNPFCTTQPKYRLEILAVFKANGHDLLLDGSFASFVEKHTISNMGPTSFTSTLSSINVVNLANIPAATAPTAVLSKDLAATPPRITRPSDNGVNSGGNSRDNSLDAISPRGVDPTSPVKLVKKKLVKAPKRVSRIVNLDSDHENDEAHSTDGESDEGGHGHDAAHSKILGSPAPIAKKKLVKKKVAHAESGNVVANGNEEKPKKKKVVKKKVHEPVSPAQDGTQNSNIENDGISCTDKDREESNIDHSQCKDNRHVHRAVQLEESMNGLTVSHTDNSNNNNHSHTHHHKKITDGLGRDLHNNHHQQHKDVHHSNNLQTPSQLNYFSSDDDGVDKYKRTIEDLRKNAGTKWLSVYAEMDGESQSEQQQET
ncbi:hypothetical protein BGZ49_000399 [Haplosporangium sp. Z 27]|nr:hypothetical protein BGZ49_000399 [Haplosporangium sp. Z 27]